MRRESVLAFALSLTSGCALFTKADPVVPRYYTPETMEARVAVSSGGAAARSPVAAALRIGHVSGAAYLKERIAYRSSGHEIGFYEDERWTERPEVYLQHALDRSLFEERGLKRALDLSAPSLTADLLEFEEVTSGALRVRLRVHYTLLDERTELREQSLSVERPVAAGPDRSQGERVAAALGGALDDVVEKIADQVTTALAARGLP